MRKLLWPMAFLLSGCYTPFGTFMPSMPVPVPEPTGGAVAVGPVCNGDAQCLSADDVLVCDSSWACQISHQQTAPSPATKNQGQFFVVSTGQSMWTDRWYQTRLLQVGEKLQLGEPVLYYCSRTDSFQGEDGVFLRPTSREDAITRSWCAGKVSDLGNLFKGMVMVAPFDRLVALSAIRVPVASGTMINP